MDVQAEAQIRNSKTAISVKLPPADGSASAVDSPATTYRDVENFNHPPPNNTPVGASAQPQAPITVKPIIRTSPIRKDNTQIRAARSIERCWLRYRDRQMFQLLKHSVCAAEHSLSYEILRKVSPKEAEFFKDPSCNIKVRFRFGGSEFPPEIFFKIFVHSDGAQVNYITGKKVLTANSEAARDACGMMGPRKFYDILIQDVVHHEQYGITDEMDITTSKDYMQYLSTLDETPAYLGGKENYWRKLTLTSLPRTTIFFDLVDFAYSRKHYMTPRLRKELPVLLSRPVTQDIQRQHIRIISQFRHPLVSPEAPHPTPKSRPSHSDLDTGRVTGRRSRRAQQRTARMRQMYENEGKLPKAPTREVTFNTEDTEFSAIGLDEGWDQEAEDLYQWSQGLVLDEVNTPRLATMMSGLS